MDEPTEITISGGQTKVDWAALDVAMEVALQRTQAREKDDDEGELGFPNTKKPTAPSPT